MSKIGNYFNAMRDKALGLVTDTASAAGSLFSNPMKERIGDKKYKLYALDDPDNFYVQINGRPFMFFNDTIGSPPNICQAMIDRSKTCGMNQIANFGPHVVIARKDMTVDQVMALYNQRHTNAEKAADAFFQRDVGTVPASALPRATATTPQTATETTVVEPAQTENPSPQTTSKPAGATAPTTQTGPKQAPPPSRLGGKPFGK